jgi:purine-nucleoside phosphorylase
MSTHIGAEQGAIAETILLPGDPLRAEFVAKTYLDDAVCYNKVRGMYGFTGTYKGKRVSVQGSGMGIPSISIYVHELITEYQVKNLIRIGSCGAMQPDIEIMDIILAMSSATDSQVNRIRFKGMDYAPTADFKLLLKAHNAADALDLDVHIGTILSTDTFYGDDENGWKLWAEYNVLAAEMETTALYTIAAKYNVSALSVLSVSDHMMSGKKISSEKRQTGFDRMIRLSLELV